MVADRAVGIRNDEQQREIRIAEFGVDEVQRRDHETFTNHLQRRAAIRQMLIGAHDDWVPGNLPSTPQPPVASEPSVRELPFARHDLFSRRSLRADSREQRQPFKGSF